MKQRRTHIRVIVLMFAFALLVCACQPTPNEPIVNAGDDTELNDKIEATPIPTPEAPEENLTSIYNFPTEIKDEFECLDTDVSVKVDADIIVPDVQSVPVVEVEPTIISAEFVRNFTETMHPGVTFYDKKDIMTKSEVQKWIDHYLEVTSKSFEEFFEEYNEDNFGNGDEETARFSYELAQYALEEYKKLLPTAPDDDDRMPTDFTYHDLLGYYQIIDPELAFIQNYHGDTPDDINMGRKFMQMTGTAADSTPISIHVMARPDKDITSTFTYELELEPAMGSKMTLSESEAVALGNETIDKMGLADAMVLSEITAYNKNGFPLSSLGGEVKSYDLVYHRGFSGIIGSDVSIQNEYGFINGNEFVRITIQSDRVTKIEYENPYNITKVENENVGLISFEEAYAAFKNQARIEFTKGSINNEVTEVDGVLSPYGDGVKSGEVTITKVRFVMVRIPIKDGGYRYVPAWRFFGSRDIDYKEDGGHLAPWERDGISFLTINAVDGTRIDGVGQR